LPSIEDFTQELFDGTKKEVEIPKEKVTQLSPGWTISKINLPHKGSKGSMRNGRLHAHDMGDHYSVHLDTVDPEASSFGHLVKDAPLVFMIFSGFKGAVALSKGDDLDDMDAAKKAMKPMAIIGTVFLILGILIMAEQMIALGLFVLATIIGLIGMGVVFIYKGAMKRDDEGAWMNFGVGIVAFLMGILILLYPGLALFFLILALVIWTFASGLFLLFGRGDKLLFDEFSIVPLTVGFISLIIAIMLILNPMGTLTTVVWIGGLLLFLIGAAQAISALLIYNTMRKGEIGAGK
jgi:uncharacterized membrane protein HdeD (DUF308 family)